jgi:hypothetical protein
MNQLDFLGPFYEQEHSHDDFVASVEGVMSSQSREFKVTAIPFSTSIDPELDFARYETKSLKLRLITTEKSLYLFDLEYKYRDGKHKRIESGKFYVYCHQKYKNVFVAISLESGSFIRRGLIRLLQSRFPLIVVGFLPQTRLNRMLSNYQEKHGYSDLIVTRATQRLRLSEEGTHRRVMPLMSWPDMSLSEAIEWIRDHNGWFQSVQFKAKRGRQIAVQVSLTRDGLVKCDDLFSQVWDDFVEPICKTHHENFNLFTKRSRRDNPDLLSKPLVVRFERDQFEDVEENKRFIQSMRSMHTTSVSVLHGNPYIHLGLIDYLDGSAFDLWVLDAQELIIVPQMHASIGSIQRLVNHVFDTYAEGEIVDYVSEGR